MNYFLTIVVIVALIWFVFALQKWRKIILQSISPFDSDRVTQRKKIQSLMIDVFSLGMIGLIILLALKTFCGVVQFDSLTARDCWIVGLASLLPSAVLDC